MQTLSVVSCDTYIMSVIASNLLGVKHKALHMVLESNTNFMMNVKQQFQLKKHKLVSRLGSRNPGGSREGHKEGKSDSNNEELDCPKKAKSQTILNGSRREGI